MIMLNTLNSFKTTVNMTKNQYLSLCAVALSIALLTSCKKDDPDTTGPKMDGHEYVDLGLPSGALWATEELNVNGSPFFAWGETEPKEYYQPDTYKFGKDSAMTKYCTKADFGQNGFIDGRLELEPEDDAVAKHWGGHWCMPNWNELVELNEGCTWQIQTDDKGVKYFLGTSKYNGKQIRVPTTGAMTKNNILHAGGGAFYWSRTLLTDSCNHVAGLAFTNDGNRFRDGRRIAGHCIRPVVPGKREVFEQVDLGLPSGLKWASKNIGALRTEKAGLFYSWAELKPKVQYDFTDYKYCSATNEDGTLKTLTKYITNNQYGEVDNLTLLDDEDDVAQQVWGNGWRMPTLRDINELLENCENSVETVNGVSGTKFTGPNGNTIFLPWVGTMYQGALEYPERGYYWSSSLGNDDKFGEGLFISTKMVMRGNGFTRCSGRCVRAVHK